MFRKTAILLILILSTMSIASTQAQLIEGAYNPLVIEHDGLQRMAHVYEPEGDINAVMIALHGFYSSGRALESLSGLNSVADERGWVIVYPESEGAYWDDGRVEAGLPPVNDSVDDFGYLASLSDTLRENYAVDDVYLTGLALGGTMAMRAVCETPEKYDGVAIVNALMWTYQTQYCDNTDNPAKMDMIFIKGDEDHIYWTEGRQIESLNQEILSAQATVTFWGEQKDCEAFSNGNVGISILVLGHNCREDSNLAYLSVGRGGNNWSSGTDTSLNRTGIDTARVIAAFLSGDEDWQSLTIQENAPLDVPRSYTLYVPTTYDAETATPVVLSLHGLGANNFSQAASSGFNQLAEAYGFIVVYPQAYDPNFNDPANASASWNYNIGTSIEPPGKEDDDTFLDMLVDDLALSLNVDMNRLYVSGLSNGGYMTNHLACTRADRYAAFAAVAASAPFGLDTTCDMQNNDHAPIMFYNGTADYISPWDGALVPGRNIYLLAPVPTTVSFWLAINDCGDNFQQQTLESNDPASTVMYVQYTDCPDDAAVELYAVVGGGHVWHGVQEVNNDFLGENNMDVNASEAIWDFFSRFSLDGRDDSGATDFSLSKTSEIIGTGLPAIPMTLAELVAGDDFTPELQLISAFQRGNFKLYFALDLSEPFDCEADTLDEDLLTTLEGTATALSRMIVRTDAVIALDDCRAFAAAEQFTNDPGSIIRMADNSLLDTLISLTTPGKVIIIIGDRSEIEGLLGADIEDNYSIAIQSDGNTFHPLASFPPDTWVSMADYYESVAGN